jgi:hypothetical protein
MQPETANLIVVAYPSDETMAFASVCEGSDIVAVGGIAEKGFSDAVRRDFQRAAAELGARRALCLDLSPDGLFPTEVLESTLRAKQPCGRVYTHSPFDEDAFRVNVVLAVSNVFGSIWIQAAGCAAMETHVLSPHVFGRKMEIVNAVYSEHLLSIHGASLSHTSLPGVEAFTQATQDEVMRAAAVSSGLILDHPDAWGFWSSKYELQRRLAACELLGDHLQTSGIKDILEIGACEGEMTEGLRHAFPQALVTALESNQFFAARLRERFRNDKKVAVLESCMTDTPLQADLIIAAEVLYYLEEEDLLATVKRLQAKYILTSGGGEFDLTLGEMFQTLGWRNVGWRKIHPRFEPVDGGESRLISCRRGTNVRLWERTLTA